MFTTTDANGKQIKLASTVNAEGEHTLASAGGSLDTTDLAKEAKQDAILTVLGNILTELQTANGHLATIAENTAPA
jgi:hypothetical protein